VYATFVVVVQCGLHLLMLYSVGYIR